MSALPRPRRVRRRRYRLTFRPRLVVFAKAPVAGSVKSRLARQLGIALATRFARQCAQALLARVAFDRRWETVVAVTPDAQHVGRFWPAGIGRCAQGIGDLGERMQRIMASLPPGPLVIIGTDIPAVRAEHIAQAFHALGRHDAVFGPAGDGGYWLVGLRRRPRVLSAFCGVRWSSPHALADTLDNLSDRNVAFLAVLGDVDDARDFVATAGAFGRRVLPR